MTEINSMIEKFAALDRLEYLANESEIRSLTGYEITEMGEIEEEIEYFTENN